MPYATRGRTLFLLLSVAVVTPIVAMSLLGAAPRAATDDDDDSLYKYLAVFTDVLGLVRTTYVEPVEIDTLIAGALEGTVDALDPYAVFVPAKAAEGFVAASAVGSSRSGLAVAHEHGVIFAARVEEGSPAAAAGIETGDILARLDGRPSREIGLWEVEQRLASPAGTKVAIEWIRRGKPREVELTLGSYPPPLPRLEAERGIPVLRLPRLDAAAAAEAKKLLAGLPADSPRRLILDLRGAGGGPTDAAFAVAGLLADGELGRLMAREKVLAEWTDAEPDLFLGELAVVVDASTSGGGELLAAILQQKAGGRLVGQRTFGFAGRQELVEVAGGSRLRLATAFFCGPDGKLLDEGLAPDLRVDESTRSFAEKDVPVGDLMRRRAAALLLGEAKLPEKKAA